MSDQGDFEQFSGPAAKEQSEVSDEKFQEQMRKTQAAVKRLQKEEGQAKKNDSNLAKIIVQFLGQSGNTNLFLLISRVVAQNIPSELIIAILSLVDKHAEKETKGYLSGEKGKALTVHRKADFKSLDPKHKKDIDEWVHDMFQVAAKRPHLVLDNMVNKASFEISPTLIQLSAFILRDYLAKNDLNVEFEILHEFMQGVFVEMIKNLEHLVKEQRKIEA